MSGYGLRLTGACLLLLFFLLAAIANAQMLIRRMRGPSGPSLVPVLGGLSGMVGMLIMPWPSVRIWAWVPLLLDVGSVPIIAMTLFYLARSKRP
jgi:hypothetical protein